MTTRNQAVAQFMFPHLPPFQMTEQALQRLVVNSKMFGHAEDADKLRQQYVLASAGGAA